MPEQPPKLHFFSAYEGSNVNPVMVFYKSKKPQQLRDRLNSQQSYSFFSAHEGSNVNPVMVFYKSKKQHQLRDRLNSHQSLSLFHPMKAAMLIL